MLVRIVAVVTLQHEGGAIRDPGGLLHVVRDDEDGIAPLELEHQLLDDNSQSSTSFRTDLAAWVIALYKPTATLRVRARVRFLDEAIASSTFGETSLATSVDVGTAIRGVDRLRVRIDSKFWLDDRRTTPDRDPKRTCRGPACVVACAHDRHDRRRL